MQKARTNWLWRGGIYALGMVVMSFGITLSTKTGLGVSTITSLPYAISYAFDLNFSVMVFLIYAVIVALQFLIKGKNRQWRDLLQFPVSMVYSAFLEWFGTLIPLHFEHLWQNVLMMGCAVTLTGVGVAMMVNMQIVSNPPDGLAQTMGVAMKKDMGLAKNLLDFIFVALAVVVDLLFSGKLISVGLGTVIAMIFIGRTISVFNHFCKEKLLRLAGLA